MLAREPVRIDFSLSSSDEEEEQPRVVAAKPAAKPAPAAAAAASSSSALSASAAAHVSPSAAAVAPARQPHVPISSGGHVAPDEDGETNEADFYDIDDLVDMEQHMEAEAAAADDAAEATGGIDYGQEGGGFFADDAANDATAAAAARVGPSIAAEGVHMDPDEPGFAPGASASSSGAAAGGAAAASSSASSSSGPVESLAEDVPPRLFASGCRECGSIGIQASFQSAFGVQVCYRCQRANPLRYALITQTTATAHYMLPVATLQQRLGYIEKKNPHKQAWGVMKLYWKQQVLALVRERYGTLDALNAAKHARDLAKITADDSRRRTVHRNAARAAAFESTVAASIADMGSKTPAQVVEMLARRTKGMAPNRDKEAGSRGSAAASKRRRSRKKDEEEAAGEDSEEEADHPRDEDETDLLAGSSSGSSRKKSRKSSAAAPAKKSQQPQQLHHHVFVNEKGGGQKCKECGFVIESESL